MNEVSDKTWATEVEQAATPVLVMFSGRWCAPCKSATPVVEAFERACGGRVKVLKADVEKAGGASMDAHVSTLPTFVLYARGEAVGKHVGFDARLVDTLRGMVGVMG